MKNWLRNIEKDAKEYFGAIINDVGSVRTVHGIKTAANEIGVFWNKNIGSVHVASVTCGVYVPYLFASILYWFF